MAAPSAPAPQRAWCFTLNNPANNGAQLFEGLQYTRYCIFQMEVGENGTPHAQGYIELTKPCRLTAMKNMIPGAHFEPRRGTREQARDYCRKEDTRLEGPFEYGNWSAGGAGKRNDLAEVKRKIDDGATWEEVADEHFQTYLRYERGLQSYKRLKQPKRNWKTKVIVLVGDAGAGKSHWVRENYPDAYWKQNSKWWCGYDSHETVVLDDFYGWIPWSTLLNVMDCYPLTVESKGGNLNFVAKTVIITSNVPPLMWYDMANPHYNRQALLRRIDEMHGFKLLEGQRIMKTFTDYYEFQVYTTINSPEDFPSHMSIDSNSIIQND